LNNKKNTVLIIFLTFLVTSLLYVGMHIFTPVFSNALNNIASFLTPEFNKSDSLEEVRDIIKDNYIDEIDDEKLKEQALKGYVLGLDDPYSEYYTKDEYNELTADINGSYKGIGIEVTIDDNNLITIITAYEGAPAANAGLISGDCIIKVNGKNVNGDNYNEAIAMMRGSGEYGKSDDLKITVKRGEKTFVADIIRDQVEVATVKSKMLENNIGYVKLERFAEESDEDFKLAVKNLLSSGAESLIIDLRNNPGGILTTVVNIADFLLPEGTILTIEGRNGVSEKFSSDKDCVDIPMCVLINGGSASASEVLSGALKDHKKAILVGENSFGKGVVQSIYNLKNGDALKITTSKYYTPDGTCIDGKGIKPDHEVKMELTKTLSLYTTDEDVQLKKAIEVLK